MRTIVVPALGERVLSILPLDDGSFCWRQINPRFVGENDLFLLEAFRAIPNPHRQLSVGHSSKITAEDCFAEYTKSGELKSAGVAPIPVSEIGKAIEQGINTYLVDDSANDDVPDWHCYIDFDSISTKRERLALSTRLAAAANKAGWAFTP